jgi:hypothetical protein
MAVIPITPSTYTFRASPKSTFTPLFTADRSVTWSSTDGAPFPLIATAASLGSIPNRTQTIILTGTSGADSGTATISVYGTFPVQPHYNYSLDIDNKTLASYSEDGTAEFRKKGKLRRIWQLSFLKSPTSDWTLIRDFWNNHEKHIPFYYQDIAVQESIGGVETPVLRLVTFDSGLKVVPNGPDAFTINIVLREF